MSVSLSITTGELEALNSDEGLQHNLSCLQSLGGTSAVLKKLDTDKSNGISSSPAHIAARAKAFGLNSFPEPEKTTWMELFIGSFNDTTIQILIAAAAISLGVGIYEDPNKGWIEGVAIIIAILIVAIVTACNDYEKEKQFRMLNAVKDDVFVVAVRGGESVRIKAKDLVVGDLVKLHAGDKIPADGIIVEAVDVTCNESSLTGEPDEKVKNPLPEAAANGKTSKKRGGKSTPTAISDDVDPFLLSGTTISSGFCTMLVTAVGESSKWGQTKAKLAVEHEDTPLQEKLDTLAAQIGIGGLVAAVATFVVMMVQWKYFPQVAQLPGVTLIQYIIRASIMAVTIVVVAVPEGLPLAVTISLAYSTQKMMKDNNLIRVLAACETMGNATNICSDKTGTLTQNRMVCCDSWVGGGRTESIPGSDDLNKIVVSTIISGVCVNSTAEIVKSDDAPAGYEVVGNQTEGALLTMVRDAFKTDYKAVRASEFSVARGDRIFAFNSDRKLMSTIVLDSNGGNNATIYCKGAPEVVLALCTHYTDSSGAKKSLAKSGAVYKNLQATLLSMSEHSLRTVALAHAPVNVTSDELTDIQPEELEGHLILDAIYGIRDPLREDVPAAVAMCQEAGIMVRMVTGDNIDTAKAIASECGILTADGVCMEGPEFRKLTPKQLDEVLPKLQVLARSTPSDKYLLVCRLNGHNLPENQEDWETEHPGCDYDKQKDQLLPGHMEEWALSRLGGCAEVVGVTGDGTNDGPALRAADVGLSMGITGTDVAKEASDIVILDDNFSSIVKAVMWGRSVFDNIRKFLQFQLTVNIVALTLTFLSAVTGYEPPLNAVMMLWVNLIMDTMGALALGTEPPSKELLKRRPYRRDASLISRVMWSNIAVQSFFQIVLLCYLLIVGADDFGVVEGSTEHYTIIFTTFVFCQVFNEFNARSIGHDFNVFCGLYKNIIFVLIEVFTVLTQYLIVQYGGDFIKVVPLSVDKWQKCVLLAALTLPIGGIMRFSPISESAADFATLPDTSKRSEKSGKEKKSESGFRFSGLVWLVTVTVIPVMVWSVFGELWLAQYTKLQAA